MNDFDISGITGMSDQSNFSIQNNYRFDALIRAIDFFAQKFNLETLIDFAGDFINEILTLNSSAVFVYDESDDSFVATKIRLYKSGHEHLPNSKKLQDIAKLYGTIITKNFQAFFPDSFLQTYMPSLLIPLIHNDELLGFIVTDGKVMGEFDEDDYSMAKALMLLFNNAFDRNYYVFKLGQNEKKIDKLAFELYAANITSQILFDEINIDKLLTTGLEVFSEVSGSRSTAFAVRDADNKNTLNVKAFKDMKTKKVYMGGLSVDLLEAPEFSEDKYVYKVDGDFDGLSKIFKNPGWFKEHLDAEYVILIIKRDILGFVTLGSSKAAGYTPETFSVISALAAELENRFSSLVNEN